MRRIVDTNMILRYILNDIPEMHDEAAEIIANGVYTTPDVLAEVVYVLHGIYKLSREEIGDALLKILEDVRTDHPEIYNMAAHIYMNRALDFVDCVLIARHRVLGDEIYSFDKKLNAELKK